MSTPMPIYTVILFIGLTVSMSGANDERSFTQATAAGPRPGPVVVTEVTLPHPTALTPWIEHGYDISHITARTVTVYATPTELHWLKIQGYTLREIEWQLPSPQTD